MALLIAACAAEPEEPTAEEPTAEEPTAEEPTAQPDDAEMDGEEPFPTDSIEYVIPFDAGGESDITARIQQAAAGGARHRRGRHIPARGGWSFGVVAGA